MAFLTFNHHDLVSGRISEYPISGKYWCIDLLWYTIWILVSSGPLIFVLYMERHGKAGQMAADFHSLGSICSSVHFGTSCDGWNFEFQANPLWNANALRCL